MSAVVGIDLSSFCVDIVKLDETSNAAEWTRCPLEGGALAWERLLRLPEAMPPASYWDDVYLIAIEAPHGRGEAGTQAKLNQVAGAVTASLPARLRVPERCWLVAPHEWKNGLKLKAKPTGEDVERLLPDHAISAATPSLIPLPSDAGWQNGLDAICLALWTRTVNQQAVDAA